MGFATVTLGKSEITDLKNQFELVWASYQKLLIIFQAQKVVIK